MSIATEGQADFLPVVLSAVFVLGTASWLNQTRKKRARKAELKSWASQALEHRDKKIHNCLTVESPGRDDETSFPETCLETTKLIQQRKLDPAAHVVVLAKRCRKYGRGPSNAITEEFYDEAYESAKLINPRDKKPLLGVPISVKDLTGLKGALSTCGMACRTVDRAQEDSLMVSLLRDAGALPLCRGNVTQVMMLSESTNFVWGRSRNPWDLARTPGGSSGGDAALVALKCVPLAVGSDVAGSLRIPAAFSGVVGFKPSSTRFSKIGVAVPRVNSKGGTVVAIPSTLGPLGKTVEDCAQFLKAVCVPRLWETDRNLPPLPFNSKAYEEKGTLTIGYYESDGWFEPCVTAKRALRQTIDALTKAGHKCVPFKPPTDGWAIYGLLVGINAAEGNMRGYIEALEGEEMIPEYNYLVQSSSLPNWLRPLVRKLVDKRRAHILSLTRSGGVSVWELWQRTAELVNMRSVWANAVRDSGVDAILHPALPTPAMPHGITGKLTPAMSYTFLGSLLLWPCGVVPVTTVQPDEQYYGDSPDIQHDDFLDKHAAIVMKDSAGLPMSVAVMTTMFEDEKCLRVMKEVERVVDFKEEPTAYEDE